MLGWIFKKKDNAATVRPAEALRPPAAAPAAPKPGGPGAAKPPAPPPGPAVDWAARLDVAHGDDEALLALALSAGAPLATRQAAVEALTAEGSLQRAERDFRNRDRRVHQAAKRRLQALVAARQTREQAAGLIDTACRLAAQDDAPLNLVAELDRGWKALDATLIDPVQREAYEALTAQLGMQARARTDRDRQRKRWLADATQAQRALKAACEAAAEGTQDRDQLAQAVREAEGVRAARPWPSLESAVSGSLSVAAVDAGSPDAASAAALVDLQQALELARALDVHLADLVALENPAGSVSAEEPPSVLRGLDDGTPAVAEAAPDPEAPPASEQPSPAPAATKATAAALPPLSDPRLQAWLDGRRARVQRSRQQAQGLAQQEAQAQRREQSRERQRSRQEAQGSALAEVLAQVETALDEGRLAEAQRHLERIDEARPGTRQALEALRGRLVAVQARLAELRGWQHWAGGRARDELVAQAEALAEATVGERPAVVDGAPVEALDAAESGAAEAPAAPAEGAPAEAPTPPVDQDEPARVAEVPAASPTAAAEVARLSIRQRADLIATLRQRWQELDRLGAAGSRALWLRFDAALKTAAEPLAAHAAAQRAARAANLAVRTALIEALEAAAPAVEGEGPPDPATARPLAAALERFRVEWRKLGPPEHTVPRAAQPALMARMQAAVQRLEAPLATARQVAHAEREALVARARALASEGPGRERADPGAVRDLQAEWQRQAQALPLARADERALWTAFRGALDQIFAARDAAFQARAAEFEAHAAERQALIERLHLNPEDSPAAQRRLLAEVDAAWQRCGPAPRVRAQALDAAYWQAREALRQWVDQAAQREWKAVCEALDAKRGLCETHEAALASGMTDAVALKAAWQALPALPTALEAALRQRAGLVDAPRNNAAAAVDEWLLQLEMAWDLPTPAPFEAARREHKLRALKVALEGRQGDRARTFTPDEALAHLLAQSGLHGVRRERLEAAVAAWRQRGLPRRP